MSYYTEDHLVEQPAIQLMQHELGWDVVNCYDEWSGGVSHQGRDGKREVVLVSRLRPALQRLNPDLPVEEIEGTVEEICRDRTALSLAEANREIDKLLKQGVKVWFSDQEHGGQRVEVVSVVDWEVPENNDFLLDSQFWVAGELYLKRPDLVGFVNGLPLVLIELKKPGVNVREGFPKPPRLQADDPAAIPLQRAAAGLERGAKQDRQPDGGVGAFRRLEEGDEGGGRGGDFAGNAAARDVRERAAAGSDRELHPLFRQQGRREQAAGEESSVSRSEPRYCGFGPHPHPDPLPRGEGGRCSSLSRWVAGGGDGGAGSRVTGAADTGGRGALGSAEGAAARWSEVSAATPIRRIHLRLLLPRSWARRGMRW